MGGLPGGERRFFRSGEKRPSGGEGQPTERWLDQALCRLIALGHAGAADYGWSWFTEALEEAERCELERLRSLSVAVRVAMHGDEKTWKAWMQDGEDRPKREPRPEDKGRLLALQRGRVIKTKS